MRDRHMLLPAALICLAAMAPAGDEPGDRLPGPGNPPLTKRTLQSGGEQPAEQAALTIEAADLAITVLPDKRAIKGMATLTVATRAPLRRLLLDLDRNLPVSAISIDGMALDKRDWSNAEGRLSITLPRPVAAGGRITARISYGGTPHVAVRAPWDGGFVWSTVPGGKPWIATAVQGEGCDLFWPCIDHPAGRLGKATVAVTVPDGLVAVGNGVADGMTRNRDGTTTWRWKSGPINPYLIALNIGPYAELTERYTSRYGNSVPMHLWVLKGHEAQGRGLLAEFAPTLDFFETMIGPFPFAAEKLGVAETPHLGMEHQTINAYGNGFKKAPEGFDWLFQHELAHEWFGNQMTAADWDDFWLHEGFAQYMQPLYGQWREGEARYAVMMAEQRLRIRNRMPIVSGKSRAAEAVYDEAQGGPGADIYFKGSWILHTLRHHIGDKAFFAATRRLVYGRADPKPGNFAPRFATTREFETLVREEAGQDLGWFFDVYLREAALPDLVMTRTGSRLTLTWKTPGNRPFPLPVEIAIDGVVRTVAMPGNRAEMEVPAGAHVVLDPMARVLRRSEALEAMAR